VSQRQLTKAEHDAPYPYFDDPAADKLRTLLVTTVCSVQERIFPIEACR